MSATRNDSQTTVTDTESRQLVVFSLGGEEYALPIAAVSEIIRHAAPRAVASDEPGVRGVIALRGKIIPVVDLADRLGVVSAQVDEDDTKVVILDIDGEHMGVMVDDVDEVITVSADQLEGVPTAGSAIEAIAKVDDRLVVLLDVGAFMAPAGR